MIVFWNKNNSKTFQKRSSNRRITFLEPQNKRNVKGDKQKQEALKRTHRGAKLHRDLENEVSDRKSAKF